MTDADLDLIVAENLCRRSRYPDTADVISTLIDELRRVRADAQRLRELLQIIISLESDPCRLVDHGRYCQEHHFLAPCPIPQAWEALGITPPHLVRE